MAGTKIEPRSHAINHEYPAQLGEMRGNHITGVHATSSADGGLKAMTTGPGLKAPMVSQQTSNKGSQGRY